MKNTFLHDNNISSDLRMMYLELKCGITGYALYFKLLEYLSKQNGDSVVSDFKSIQNIAHSLNVDYIELSDMINCATMPNVGLLVRKEGKLFSRQFFEASDYDSKEIKISFVD